MKEKFSLRCLCAATLVSFGSASSADPFFGRSAPIEGEIAIEIGSDSVGDSEEADEELTDLYLTLEPYVSLALSESFSLEAFFIFEAVQDPRAGKDRFFDDHGLFVEQLSARFEQEAFSVYAGKFTPAFGMAWDEAPDIYGADFVEDYEMTERIGVGVDLRLMEGERVGSLQLQVASFFTDTSFLSQSLITSRGRSRLSDGGAGNTEDLSSFTISINGEALGGNEGLFYHAAYRSQKKGAADPTGHDEAGWVFGLGDTVELSERWRVSGIVEYAAFENMYGADADVEYWTGSLTLNYKEQWSFSYSYTRREVDESGILGSDYLSQLAAGYAFENGIAIHLAYLKSKEDGVSSHTLGLLSTYTFTF